MSVPEFMRESIVYFVVRLYDVVIKQFTFAISSPDQLLVSLTKTETAVEELVTALVYRSCKYFEISNIITLYNNSKKAFSFQFTSNASSRDSTYTQPSESDSVVAVFNVTQFSLPASR